MTQTMSAIRFDRFGGPEVLRWDSAVPRPVPRKDEVLVRVRAVGVNPGDAGVVAGQLKFMTGSRFPQTPGLDVAGDVVGSHPSFPAGGAVMGFIVGSGHTYAEYVSVPAKNLAAVPPSLRWEQAGALPVAGVTAAQAVEAHGAVAPGERVLIRGASGGVGHLAVQLAVARGARVTAIASEDAWSWLKTLGAEHTVGTAASSLRTLEPFDVIIDARGELSWSSYARLLRRGGRVVTLRPSVPNLVLGWAAPLLGVPRLVSMIVTPDRTRLEELGRAVARGTLQLRLDGTFPLYDAAEAHRRLSSGKVRGKLVLLAP